MPGRQAWTLTLRIFVSLLSSARWYGSFAPPGGQVMMMMWVQIATGFTGALTLVFVFRWLARTFGVLPSMTVYFSPKGGCQDALVREIQSARREVLVQAYSFTSEPVANALIDAKKRGLHVDILLDRSNEQETRTDLHLFHEQGLAPLIDHDHAIAHNKVMIIDQQVLITGSFNFTNQAEHENAENLLMLRGHGDLVRSYRQNFLAHKAHCKAPQGKALPAPAPAAEHKATPSHDKIDPKTTPHHEKADRKAAPSHEKPERKAA
jgi:phosphatidylserine/phosphatidylglycerophosphate/cardiolipin synthase-like enzyme